MDKREFIQLLKKVREGTATEEEQRFVDAYYALFDVTGKGDPRMKEEVGDQLQEAMLDEIWRKIEENASGIQRTPTVWKIPAVLKIPTVRKAAAAVMLLVAGGAVFYLISDHHPGQPAVGPLAVTTTAPDSGDIFPAGNRAVLSLANGQRIVLDSAQEGMLARQGETKVVKLADGHVAYQGAQDGEQLLYNTISTPKGGQYTLTLSDGSKVWLNAASRLRFPTAFSGGTRRVEMEGEVYFEVAKQAGRPFIVETGGTSIEVLGTRFNVNTYDENTVRTTLAEGQVRISRKNESSLLTPGQEAVVREGTSGIQVQRVNVDKALAWKNGLFHFENTNIRAIMREVSRWYDVEVVYQTGDLENKNFSGVLSRYSHVSALLKRLELTGTVRFKIEGQKILVTE